MKHFYFRFSFFTFLLLLFIPSLHAIETDRKPDSLPVLPVQVETNNLNQWWNCSGNRNCTIIERYSEPCYVYECRYKKSILLLSNKHASLPPVSATGVIHRAPRIASHLVTTAALHPAMLSRHRQLLRHRHLHPQSPAPIIPSWLSSFQFF